MKQLTERITARCSTKLEDGVLLADGLSAGWVSLRSGSSVREVESSMLLNVIYNVAEDNGERILVLSNKNPQSTLRRSSALTSIGSAVLFDADAALHSEALAGVMNSKRIRMVVSDWCPSKVYELFTSMTTALRSPMFWIQLPASPQPHTHRVKESTTAMWVRELAEPCKQLLSLCALAYKEAGISSKNI